LPTKSTHKQIAINFGFLISAYNVSTGLLLVSLNIHYQNNTIIGLINLAVIIGLIFFGIYQLKKSCRGYLKLSEALKTGMGISLISGLTSALYSVILIYYIDPDFIEKTLDFQKQTMLKKDPNLTIEDANAILEIQKQLTGPLTTSSFIIIFNLFIGFIVSLISGLILSKSEVK
tara:strand:- start:4064 stop:4585 length:522 start_codon:yes stop_codon:yes gene_type:complete